MKNEKNMAYEEKELFAPNGWAVFFGTILLLLAALALTIFGATQSTDEAPSALLIIGIILLSIGKTNLFYCWELFDVSMPVENTLDICSLNV